MITMSLGMTYPPQSLGEGLQVTNFDQWFTYSNGYWEVYRRYQGDFFGLGVGFRGGGLYGRIFPWRNYFMGEEKFNEKGAGFSSITIKKKQ